MNARRSCMTRSPSDVVCGNCILTQTEMHWLRVWPDNMLRRPTVAKSVRFPLQLWQEKGALHFGMSHIARNGNLVRSPTLVVVGLTLVVSLATPLLAQEPDTSIFRIGEIV